jgi:hypothetical protein
MLNDERAQLVLTERIKVYDEAVDIVRRPDNDVKAARKAPVL